jgi:hypothetical protein
MARRPPTAAPSPVHPPPRRPRSTATTSAARRSRTPAAARPEGAVHGGGVAWAVSVRKSAGSTTLPVSAGIAARPYAMCCPPFGHATREPSVGWRPRGSDHLRITGAGCVARGRGPWPSPCLTVLGESPQMLLASATSTGPVSRVRTRPTGAATTSRHGAAAVRPLPARRVRVPRQAAGSRRMPRRAHASVVGDRLSRRAVQPSRLPPRRTGPWIPPAGQVSENSCPVVAPLLLGHPMPVRKTADPSRRLCRPAKQHSPRVERSGT